MRGIVVVRPELGVVVEALELEDLVFGLDVAVLGDADVDADLRLVDVRPIEPRVGDRLVGRIDADAAGPRAAAEVLFLLIAQLVEVADAGQGRRRRSGFRTAHAAAAGQQVFAKFGQIVAVGGGQADAGDDDPVVLGTGGDHGKLPCAARGPPRRPAIGAAVRRWRSTRTKAGGVNLWLIRPFKLPLAGAFCKPTND